MAAAQGNVGPWLVVAAVMVTVEATAMVANWARTGRARDRQRGGWSGQRSGNDNDEPKDAGPHDSGLGHAAPADAPSTRAWTFV
jgi:hypothetical protein